MLTEIIMTLISHIVPMLTSIQSIIIVTILLIVYFLNKYNKLFRSIRFPFIFTTRNTLNLVINNIKNTDKDIIDITNVYTEQLDSIIVSGITTIIKLISSFIYMNLLNNSEITKLKEHLLLSLAQLIIFDFRDAVKQLSKDKRFTDISNEIEFQNFTKSSEHIFYTILQKNCDIRWFYKDDSLYSYFEEKTPDTLLLKTAISNELLILFKDIQTHLLKCKNKTSALIEFNESIIKDYI